MKTEKIYSWEANTGVEELDLLIAHHVHEAIKQFVEDDVGDGSLYAPIIWYPKDGMGGIDQIDDPLTIRLLSEELRVYRDWSLTDDIKTACDDCAVDGSYKRGLTRISKALHELADYVDASLLKIPKAKHGS